jgi:large subunit ribosomal protein L19
VNTELITKATTGITNKRPELQVGDYVTVDTIIRDGDKKRIQKFRGIVIAIKGKGVTKTFTVRKISYGVGVEKTFPVNSANIEKITIDKHSNVKRSKLYYLRERIGKAAMKLRAGAEVEDIENEVVAEIIEEAKDEMPETEEVVETTEEKTEIKEEKKEEK